MPLLRILLLTLGVPVAAGAAAPDRALDNRYWPAFYLVDKQGRIRQLHVGETHAGDARAERIEGQLRTLLAE